MEPRRILHFVSLCLEFCTLYVYVALSRLHISIESLFRFLPYILWILNVRSLRNSTI